MAQVRLDLDLAPQLVLDARLRQLRLDEHLPGQRLRVGGGTRAQHLWA